MKWLSWLSRRKADTGGDELLARYRQLREAGRALNLALARQLPGSAAGECGKKLGMLQSGTLVLNHDDEMAVLYDYCIHHYRRGGKNAIDRYLERTRLPADSVEAALLQAMQNAYFSLFRVEEILPHRGARLRDLVTESPLDLLDLGLSATGLPGVILAGRVLPLADLSISSGTMIPVPEWVFDARLRPVIQTFTRHKPAGADRRLTPAQEASFAAQVLRIALRAGGEDNAFYTDMDIG